MFNAEPYHLGDNKLVKWQVLNAEDSEDIRGNFFHAKNSSNKISANVFENHETVQVQGPSLDTILYYKYIYEYC